MLRESNIHKQNNGNSMKHEVRMNSLMDEDVLKSKREKSLEQ